MRDEPGFGGRHADRVRENLGWCRTSEGTSASVGELLGIYRRQKRRQREPCTDGPLDDLLYKITRRIGRS